MIISASRRTDIPGIYGEWFINRLREGYCTVRNPFNPKSVYRVSLLPEDVDLFVFWTKNPAPFIRHIPELDAMGYRYYFLFTVNDYPTPSGQDPTPSGQDPTPSGQDPTPSGQDPTPSGQDPTPSGQDPTTLGQDPTPSGQDPTTLGQDPTPLEPNIPPLPERVETFRKLAGLIGPARVIWRYDPIIISSKTGYEYHTERFARLCGLLGGHTERVMTSFLTFYRKTDRNLSPLKKAGYSFMRPSEGEMKELLKNLSSRARECGMEMQACSMPWDFSDSGVSKGSCIDARLIRSLFGINVPARKDPGQRKECGCAPSRDIGITDTCTHGCPYCYSTRNHAVAAERFSMHNPSSTSMTGNPELPEPAQKNLFK